MKPILIATRGSALALVQANFILGECRARFPEQTFELNIIKTTGDKLQRASMARQEANLPKGLFTKELEEALLKGEADLAVHSLKDLPTELPDGLKLGAATEREDVRDVLIYRRSTNDKSIRGFGPHLQVSELPLGANIATSSTRRAAQLQAVRPDLRTAALRGNVGTRLFKIAAQPEFDATLLAAAGLIRLGFKVTPDGVLHGPECPANLLATILPVDELLPCVGQAAIGIEIRQDDPALEAICAALNHASTWHAITAERAFLSAMGGGCQSPVGAYAQVDGDRLRLKAVSFLGGTVRRGEQCSVRGGAEQLGRAVAKELKV